MRSDPRTPVDDLQRIAKELGDLRREVNRLGAPSRAHRQYSGAIESDADSSGLLNQGNTATPVNDLDAAVLSFTRPAWAARATVLATATFVLSGTANSPASANSRARIDGVDSPAQAFLTPIESEIRLGGVVQPELAYVPQSTRVIPFARTFDTSAASIDVSARVDFGPFGAGSSALISINATVFWSAP